MFKNLYSNQIILNEQEDLLKSATDDLIALAQKQYESLGSEANLTTASQIISEATASGNMRALGYGLFYLGAALWDTRKFPEGIEKLTEAVRLARENREDALLAKTFYLLGCCYREVKMMERALEYLNDSTLIYERLLAADGHSREWKMALARNLTISGQTLLLLKQTPQAEVCQRRALEIRQELGYAIGIASSNSNLGFIYLETEEMERAAQHFEAAIQKLKDSNYQFHYFQAMAGLAIAQAGQQLFETAIANFEMLLPLVREVPIYYSVYDIVLKHLPPLYAAKGDFERAYELTTIYASHRQKDYDHAYVDAIALLEAEQGKARREQLLQEAKHQNLKMNLAALRSQMDPHFIFNLLHSVSNKIEDQKSAEAKMILEQFALLMRQNLELAINETITLENEIDFLKNYIHLEQRRMGSKFTYRMEVDEGLEIELIRLPGMLIQPYIENAIKHGLSPLESGGLLEVIFKAAGEDGLCCVVRDNGAGIGASKQLHSGKKEISGKQFGSHGMQLTGRRIETMNALYNDKISVLVNDLSLLLQGSGTEVVLNIKL
ncbi:MAG: histidine kinase [Chitinophagales bacterium]